MHNVIEISRYPFPLSPIIFHILLFSRVLYLAFARSTEGINKKMRVFFKTYTWLKLEILVL